ncbi:hypothetical protein HDU77_010603 [Chytriomyces hyalinus]|nr:hypothetical protein HDU77_010603 [Chytriomyces hyalinus]
MGSHLGLAMTPQQLLAHVYGCADSELAVLSAEQKQVLNFITHLQMVKQQQQQQQQQTQSGMEQELSQMRMQMTQMQKYISHLVQNQSQMNGQISQLFSQLLKVTTSPCPISPPSLQSATPIDMTKSPTHDETSAHGNVSSFQDAAFAANVLNASTLQPLVNDFSFDESFEQLFGDAL